MFLNLPLVLFYLGGGLGCLALGLFAVLTGYIAYIHWRYSHLPSPKRPSFYFGHLLDVWRFQKNIGENVPHPVFVDYWAARVDSLTFVVFFVHSPMIITLDPEVVKAISMNKNHPKPKLVADILHSPFGQRFFGDGIFSKRFYEQWKPRRAIYDPAFKKSYLKALVNSFNEITSSAIGSLKPLADGKTLIPLKKHMHNLTLEVISKVGFGTDFSKWTAESLGIKMPKESDCSVFGYVLDQSLNAIFKGLTSPYPPINQYLYPSEGKVYRQCFSAMRQMGRDCIMNRIKRIEAGEEVPQDILTCILLSGMENITIEDVVDDFCTFYLAGQETTANAITFALILLIQHPNCLERAEQEIIDVLGDRNVVTNRDLERLQYMDQNAGSDKKPSFDVKKTGKCVDTSWIEDPMLNHVVLCDVVVWNDKLIRAQYLNADEQLNSKRKFGGALVGPDFPVDGHIEVVCETLRLYPAPDGIYKCMGSNTTIGKYFFPKGTTVKFQESNMCRMEQYFEDPESFNPDRFDPSKEKPNSFIYFPFGTGHRSCIGKKFTMIKLAPDYKIELIQRLTLQTKDDVPCTMILK